MHVSAGKLGWGSAFGLRKTGFGFRLTYEALYSFWSPRLKGHLLPGGSSSHGQLLEQKRASEQECILSTF